MFGYIVEGAIVVAVVAAIGWWGYAKYKVYRSSNTQKPIPPSSPT